MPKILRSQSTSTRKAMPPARYTRQTNKPRGAHVRKEAAMKQHRFWAYAMVVCAVMAIYTGKKRA